MSRYELQLPSSNNESAAIQTSLELLKLLPGTMQILVAAVYRCVLKASDFTIHIAGPSGAFKTSLAALLQQHFGPEMDERNLPGSWSSTANALETLAFAAKDALVVVDDFAPRGSMQDVHKLHGVAERVIRAAGNHSARGRLTPEGVLREYKPPRGLILSTGEDIPRGHSVRARLLVLEIAKSDINLALLTKLQQYAKRGTFSNSLAGFARWIARDYKARLADFEEQCGRIRSELPSTVHARTPGLLADLQAGFEMFLEYACEARAFENERSRELKTQLHAALIRCLSAQEDLQATAEPTLVYFDLLRTAISTKRAHFADVSGGPPDEQELWGWKKKLGNSVTDWEAPGTCIGWIEDDNLYLEPDAAFYAAQEVARNTGENLPVTKRTLNRRLDENGLLLSHSSSRRTYKIRKAILGATRNVLHLSLSKFAENAGLDSGANEQEESSFIA